MPYRIQALVATAPEFVFRLGLICLIVYVSIVSAFNTPVNGIRFTNGGHIESKDSMTHVCGPAGACIGLE